MQFLTFHPLVTTPDGSIGVMNFYFFDPGDFGPRGWHGLDPEVKIGRSKGLTPLFYLVFLWRFRLTTQENHSFKQMMVYEQITFFEKSILDPEKKRFVVL